MPPWLRPVPLQLHVEHPAWIDRIPWPNARIYLINNPFITFDDFASIYSSAFRVSWPYDHSHVFFSVQRSQSPDTTSTPSCSSETSYAPSFNSSEEIEISTTSSVESAVMNPVFEQHLRDLRNWRVEESFTLKFPELGAIIESDSQLSYDV